MFQHTQACSFFYDCSAGCISHMQCEPHSDGLPRVFDAVSISSVYQPSHKTFSMGSGLHRGLHRGHNSACDQVMEWCGLTQDVDCGSRPCSDPEMWAHFIFNNPRKIVLEIMFNIRCATQPTRTTQTTTEDCGHFFDCDAAGNGYFADPFNCRKYWHCYG